MLKNDSHCRRYANVLRTIQYIRIAGPGVVRHAHMQTARGFFHSGANGTVKSSRAVCREQKREAGDTTREALTHALGEWSSTSSP